MDAAREVRMLSPRTTMCDSEVREFPAAADWRRHRVMIMSTRCPLVEPMRTDSVRSGQPRTRPCWLCSAAHTPPASRHPTVRMDSRSTSLGGNRRLPSRCSERMMRKKTSLPPWRMWCRSPSPPRRHSRASLARRRHTRCTRMHFQGRAHRSRT